MQDGADGMRASAGRFAIMASLALAASIALPVPSVQAQGLFDALFGGGAKRRTEFPTPPAAPKNKPSKKPAAKISAPSYNQYRADPLVRVDFAKLMKEPKAEPAAFDAAAPASADAFAGLADFELFAEKPIAAALIAHYSANPTPLWFADGQPNQKARDTMRVLGEAESYGLVTSDYAVTPPASSVAAGDKQAALMRFEMEMSARALRYIRDSQGGRIDPNRISGYYDFPAKPLDLEAALTTLGASQDMAASLNAYHPKSPEYQGLRVELESLRASMPTDEIRVDPNLLLKPGQTSAELPKIIEVVARNLDDELGGEFGEVLFRLKGTETYGDELVQVIKAKQKLAGLKPDGVIGPRTVQALAGVSKADRLEKVIVALEQMRWLPSELGDTRVFINQPAYTASYFEGGQEKLNMRTVIGKVTNQTSFFYDEIEQVDYNPYWGVPQSIIVNEMLPRLRRDPGYLDRAGYEVYNAKGKRVSSSAIDWGSYGSKVPVAVRQAPSEANALGELKILFPNKHAIYMHDTPQKALFDRESRAFSHGCVRLADPRGMAAAVLGVSRDYVADKLGRGHSSEKVKRKIPVYVAYFTAWPDANGAVEYYNDVYGRDKRLMDAIAKTDTVRTPTS